MSWQYPKWTPELANKRGFAVWDLYYREWGNRTTGAGFFPSKINGVDGDVKLPNFHGIVIGGRSTVDRVMIRTNFVTFLTEGRAQGTLPTWVDGFKVLEFEACHIGMPLRGQVLGPVTVVADEIYDAATLYLPDDGSGTKVPLISAAFEQPALHLQFLQRKQDISLLAGPRMPMIRQMHIEGEDPPGERLVRIYPVGGRRGVTFQARTTLGTWSYRIGVIEAAGMGGAGVLIEQTLAIVTGVSATLPAYIDLTGRAQYLTIYATNTDDTDVADALITITDDCCGEAAVVLGGGV